MNEITNDDRKIWILCHPNGEFCSKYNEIYSSPTILFDTTESFTESCKQTLFTALSKRLSWVKYNWRWTVYFLILRAKFTFRRQRTAGGLTACGDKSNPLDFRGIGPIFAFLCGKPLGHAKVHESLDKLQSLKKIRKNVQNFHEIWTRDDCVAARCIIHCAMGSYYDSTISFKPTTTTNCQRLIMNLF